MQAAIEEIKSQMDDEDSKNTHILQKTESLQPKLTPLLEWHKAHQDEMEAEYKARGLPFY